MSKFSFIGRYGSSADIHHLIKSGEPDGVKSAMYRNPNWSQEHVDAAVKSEHPSVRMVAAAKWSSLPQEHRDSLLRDPDGFVAQRAKVAHYSNMKGDQLMSVLHDPSEKIYHVMAYEAGITNNRFKDEHIRQLTKHTDYRIRNDAFKELDARDLT